MEAPDPSAAREQLGRLVGTWRGKETMHPSPWDPKGYVADGENINRESVGGFGVVTDYRQIRDGATVFEGHGMYVWDAKANEVVLHWFDNMGMGREEFRGGWVGDVLTLSSQGPMGIWRKTTDFSAEGKLHSTIEMGTSPDALTLLFEGDYARE